MAHLIAYIALRDGMVGITGHFNDFAVLLVQQQAALVRTIQRANGGHDTVALMEIRFWLLLTLLRRH
ncbi:hypothetical protein D3C84_1242890 [compost metagenome]